MASPTLILSNFVKYGLVGVAALRRPQLYDLPEFGGPFAASEEVALNPQPLPPREAAVLAGYQVGVDLARSAIILGDGQRLVEEVHGWCGNEPKRIPWPVNRPWPWPWPPDPTPGPDPWGELDRTAIFLSAACGLASVAARMQPGDMQESFLAAGDELIATALG